MIRLCRYWCLFILRPLATFHTQPLGNHHKVADVAFQETDIHFLKYVHYFFRSEFDPIPFYVRKMQVGIFSLPTHLTLLVWQTPLYEAYQIHEFLLHWNKTVRNRMDGQGCRSWAVLMSLGGVRRNKIFFYRRVDLDLWDAQPVCYPIITDIFRCINAEHLSFFCFGTLCSEKPDVISHDPFFQCFGCHIFMVDAVP